MTFSTHRVDLARVHLAAQTIDPIFLRTPQFVCEPLSDALGIRVVLKVETINPIRSFKGRGADWLVAQAERSAPLYCASAGNFGQAMAYACRRRGLPLVVYASTTANELKVARMRALGAEVRLAGVDFDAAKDAAREAAVVNGARFVEDSRDIETVEGVATIGLELLDFPEPIDALLIALGNGAMFNGIARVTKARRPHTRMIAVQAAGAPAMVDSWRAGHAISYETVQTIADGIAVRVPVAEALDDMQGLVDDALLVQEESLVAAMRLIHQHAGIVAEPSGAAGLAALMEYPEAFRHQTVGVIVCGSNLAPAQIAAWL